MLRDGQFHHDALNAPTSSTRRPAWDDALTLGEKFGYRNAQVTVIAPTGTIGLLMDCDTTGVEPDFALTKFKKLAGGGFLQDRQPVAASGPGTGYDEDQTRLIMTYVMGAVIGRPHAQGCFR